MLTHLSIKNYALIEDLSLNFSKGFTVITGETGSGKSILIKSMELVTGKRADLSSIRSGCNECVIAANFEYNNCKITDFLNRFSIPLEDNIILIRRTIEVSGKSKAFINDVQVSLSVLSGLGQLLIDFHDQYERHSLLDLDFQLEVLDTKVDQIKLLLNKCSILQANVKRLKAKLEAMNMSEIDRLRKVDLYSFQIKEIQEAKLRVGEDEELEEELPKLKNAKKISDLAKEVISILYSCENATLSNILKVKKNIETINTYGANTSGALSLIEQAYYQTEEAYREIELILSKTKLDPEMLNSSMERLELIKKLKKKYGSTIETILEYKNKIEEELNALNNYHENSSKVKEDLLKETERLTKVCESISEKRKKVALDFKKLVQEKLFDLEIKNAIFDIKFDKKEPSDNGFDIVEFMFCANKGEKVLPLKNTASGGELSRVLLAIELASQIKSDQTTVFDEIDTGTSGRVGEKIGEKLFELSTKKQVFAITHLAQVSAFAQTHIKIYKEIEKSRTYTKAVMLSQEEHIKEVARMISGKNVTDSALEHARDLILSSSQSK
ncbi:MAG: DNA repair protein RecN [Endomicrobium sp.]|nr:DNA repair protein RecN [Endomicrobium sp.]